MNIPNDISIHIANTLHISQYSNSLQPFFNGEKFVIVVGGSGFVGSHLVSSLLSSKYSVLSIQRQRLPRSPALANAPIDSTSLFNLLGCDVADPNFDLLKCINPQKLVGCIAIINCVGIKCEGKGFNTMEGAHIEVTKKLLELCKVLNGVHIIHVSVICARSDPKSKYHDTKATAETMIQESSVPYTIIRPSVIFGRGDDMITNLVEGVRASPFFPLPGNGVHQPVHVLDVVESMVACLNHENAKGKIYEVVGPKKMTVKDMVETVSAGLGLPTYTLPFPLILHRVVAEIMPVISNNPMITPAQLMMLSEGMSGDTTPLKRDLKNPNLCSKTFSPDLISQIEQRIPSQVPFSARIITSSQHYKRLSKLLDYFDLAVLTACVAIFLSFVGAGSPFKWIYCIGLSVFILLMPPLRWYYRLLAHNGLILKEVVVGCLAGVFQVWLLWYFDVNITLRNVDNLLFLVLDQAIWFSGVLFPFVARIECASQKGMGLVSISLISLIWSTAMCLVSENLNLTSLLFRFVIGLMNSILVVRFEGLLPSFASGLVLLLSSR